MTVPMQTTIQTCRSEAETAACAAAFARQLNPGSWVGLIGPLGAGKSVFARAVGRAFGVATPMPSPSYTLLICHDGRCPVYHIDLYRITSPEELEFAGITPYFTAEGICLVEWADRMRSEWPVDGWIVRIAQQSETERQITILPVSDVTDTP